LFGILEIFGSILERGRDLVVNILYGGRVYLQNEIMEGLFGKELREGEDS